MALLEHVVRDLTDVPRSVDAVLIDGDNTLFEPQTARPYPDAEALLTELEAANLTLVSANPDHDLARRRHAILHWLARGVGSVQEIHPERARWNKFPLYAEAAYNLDQPRDITVVGDRWYADVTQGVRAAGQVHPGVKATGFVVRRPEAQGDIPIDPVLRRAEHLGFAALSRVSPQLRDRLVANYSQQITA